MQTPLKTNHIALINKSGKEKSANCPKTEGMEKCPSFSTSKEKKGVTERARATREKKEKKQSRGKGDQRDVKIQGQRMERATRKEQSRTGGKNG